VFEHLPASLRGETVTPAFFESGREGNTILLFSGNFCKKTGFALKDAGALPACFRADAVAFDFLR
jgi:hypothetical protein